MMEAENQNENCSSCSSSPEMLPPGNQDDHQTHYTHCPGTVALRPSSDTLRSGTVIPNRIFVGGIDYKVNESDLRHVFSQHGAVKEVKIVIDRSGMSKGYGFVTFETQDDAMKILHDAKGVCFKDKKLSIGQAVRRQQVLVHAKSPLVTFPDSAMPRPMSCENTSAGLPYIYHNGVAYFQCPTMSPLSHHWPAPMPPSPVVYSQQSEYLYQPADGGLVPPPPPAMEDAPPEVPIHRHIPSPVNPLAHVIVTFALKMRKFVEPPVLQAYPFYPQRADGMAPFVLQHGHRKNLMFPHAPLHLKPKHRRFSHHKDYHYPAEAAEPPDASRLHTQPPLM
ncbi:Protein boule-like [Liparis tanakae]|uniref:Protein boule-like n=1 Tax=Liparis tanakae TaxID=230148 RepID=A0A4Z2HZ61_9TELE|nr:Protein boule-like [Liparis tanakae]